MRLDIPLRFGVTELATLASGPLVSRCALSLCKASRPITRPDVAGPVNPHAGDRTEFDVAEFPLATYVREIEEFSSERYSPGPVFPSLHSRLLGGSFDAEGSGIARPADLAGKRVGIPIWDMAAAVWLRGILHEHFGLPARAPLYVTGGLEFARKGDEHPQAYPPGYTIEHADESLATLLERGEIDALYTARAPSTYRPGGPVVRLFENPRDSELAFYEKTKLFPQMHVLALRRSLAQAHPQLPGALYRAGVASIAAARAKLIDQAALDVMLPWLAEHVRETEAALGENFWASGLAANRDTLATFLRYMRAEGLVSSGLAPEDLFEGADIARDLTVPRDAYHPSCPIIGVSCPQGCGPLLTFRAGRGEWPPRRGRTHRRDRTRRSGFAAHAPEARRIDLPRAPALLPGFVNAHQHGRGISQDPARIPGRSSSIPWMNQRRRTRPRSTSGRSCAPARRR